MSRNSYRKGLTRLPVPVPAGTEYCFSYLDRVALRQTAGYARILMYHNVLEDDDFCSSPSLNNGTVRASAFRSQLAVIREFFDVVLITDIPSLLKTDRISRPVAAITFDDGMENNYSVAAPVLAEYGMHATFFVSTGFVSGQNPLWFNALEHAIVESPIETVYTRLSREKEPYKEDDYSARKTLFARAVSNARSFPTEEGMVEFVKTFCAEFGFSYGDSLKSSRWMNMTWAHLNELCKRGHMAGSHTVNHITMNRTPLHVCAREIDESMDEIENKIGIRNVTFAYPGGAANTHVVEYLRNKKVCAALGSTRMGRQLVTRMTDNLLLPRIDGSSPFRQFRYAMSGRDYLAGVPKFLHRFEHKFSRLELFQDRMRDQ